MQIDDNIIVYPPNKVLERNLCYSEAPIIHQSLMFIEFNSKGESIVGSSSINKTLWQGTTFMFQSQQDLEELKWSGYYIGPTACDAKYLNDTTVVLSEDTGDVQILNTDERSNIYSNLFLRHFSRIPQIAVWSKSSKILTCSEETIMVFDANSSRKIKEVYPNYHTESIYSVDSLKYNEHCFVSCGADRKALMWDKRDVNIASENREKLKGYQQYAEIIFCIGFFLLYFVDEIVHFIYGGTHSILSKRSSTNERTRRPTGNRYGATESTPMMKAQPPYNPAFSRERPISPLFEEGSCLNLCHSTGHHEVDRPSQLCHVGHQEPCESAAPTINFGLVLALTLHSFLEGLVVGLEGTTTKVLFLLGAICSHKFVVGFCLGLELAANTTTCGHITGILVFSTGSVAGILVGAFISNIQNTMSDPVMAVLQGLAGGTLLYVTLSEIIPRERARWHQEHQKRVAGLYQFFSIGLGFIMMTILVQYLGNIR